MVLLPGAIGTTVLGHFSQQFIFTWPLCLYAALEYVAQPRDPFPRGKGVSGVLRRRLPLVVFLLVSVAYFLACRRLSLVFEWAFLTGYVGALPVVWMTQRVHRSAVSGTVGRLAFSLLRLAAFFATSVAFLKSRY